MSEDENGEPKKVVHRMEIDRSPEIDSLHRELAEKEAMLQSISMHELQKVKEELKEKYGEYAEEIDNLSVNQINEFKARMLDAQNKGKGEPKKTIYGKSSLNSPKNEAEFTNPTKMVDDLYNVAYFKYHSEREKIDHAEEIADAKAKIDTLIKSMVSGQGWKQMRERGSIDSITKHKISACSKCHYTLVDTDICPNCGYNPKEKQAVRD